ncbi:5337_t:CDS:2 [Funneliformis geosporum]|nr:5337_t:CDS:2 [Funneliformis geosporum]
MVIIVAIRHLHDEGVIHRDLHSGNILYKKYTNSWYISDFGFCGPADMPLQSIYGNLPYIAPEVISDKRNTRASDIYSIGMLMWEISSGQPPFAGIDHDFNLAMKIINGIRPKIVSRTPLGIKELIEQCWDADPSKRPNIGTLDKKVAEIRKSYYQNENEENLANNDDRYLNVKSNTSSSSSSIYQSSRSINSELQSNLKEIRSYSIEGMMY